MRLLAGPNTSTADALIKRADRNLVLGYGAAIGVGFVIAMLSVFNSRLGFPYAASLLFFFAAATIVRPVIGIYTIAFFGLLADNVSAGYWPFLKNASSQESFLFLHESIVVSPMEGFLVLTAIATVGHAALGDVELRPPALFWPISAVMVFVFTGLLWGLGRGGDSVVALWEARPFFALYGMYLLSATLLRSRRQVQALFWVVVAAVFVESVRTLVWLYFSADTDLYDSILEHSGATHLNFIFVAAFFAWIVAKSGIALRLWLPIASMSGLWVYIESERRSGIAALVIGLLVSFIFLKADRPRRFWLITPVVVVVGLLYLGAFWNASGPLAFPAEAIRTELAPETASVSDQSSNNYRVLEHVNILATIQTSPVLGVGFGQKFYQPIPLPDISFSFPWWEYMTHNSLLWIWMKMGYFGFIAVFNFFGRGISLGMQTVTSLKHGVDKAIVGSAMAYLPMYLTFTYVDIAWQTQSLLLVAICLAIIVKMREYAELTAPESDLDDDTREDAPPLALVQGRT